MLMLSSVFLLLDLNLHLTTQKSVPLEKMTDKAAGTSFVYI